MRKNTSLLLIGQLITQRNMSKIHMQDKSMGQLISHVEMTLWVYALINSNCQNNTIGVGSLNHLFIHPVDCLVAKRDISF